MFFWIAVIVGICCNAFIVPQLRFGHDLPKIRSISTSYENGFGIEDLLSSEDMQKIDASFLRLKDLFPGVDDDSIRKIVTRSPYLLTIDTDRIDSAINRLRSEIPFIDQSYVVSQRSLGVELLICSMNPSFDFDLQKRSLHQIVGNYTNFTEFVRRVPHALVPRCLLEIDDYVETLVEYLSIGKRAAFEVIETWPGILGIHLRSSFARLESSLHRGGILDPRSADVRSLNGLSSLSGSSKKLLNERTLMLSKIIQTVPRVLVHDVSRRLAHLRNQYPGWNLAAVIRDNPRVLTQKLDHLHGRYEVRVI